MGRGRYTVTIGVRVPVEVKAAWDSLPEPVKSAVRMAFEEMVRRAAVQKTGDTLDVVVAVRVSVRPVSSVGEVVKELNSIVEMLEQTTTLYRPGIEKLVKRIRDLVEKLRV